MALALDACVPGAAQAGGANTGRLAVIQDCGDGHVSGSEACDGGTADSADWLDGGCSEDCLTVDVWTPPRNPQARPAPVLVFFYGGGALSGASGQADVPLSGHPARATAEHVA